MSYPFPSLTAAPQPVRRDYVDLVPVPPRIVHLHHQDDHCGGHYDGDQADLCSSYDHYDHDPHLGGPHPCRHEVGGVPGHVGPDTRPQTPRQQEGFAALQGDLA